MANVATLLLDCFGQSFMHVFALLIGFHRVVYQCINHNAYKEDSKREIVLPSVDCACRIARAEACQKQINVAPLHRQLQLDGLIALHFIMSVDILLVDPVDERNGEHKQNQQVGGQENVKRIE